MSAPCYVNTCKGLFLSHSRTASATQRLRASSSSPGVPAAHPRTLSCCPKPHHSTQALRTASTAAAAAAPTSPSALSPTALPLPSGAPGGRESPVNQPHAAASVKTTAHPPSPAPPPAPLPAPAPALLSGPVPDHSRWLEPGAVPGHTAAGCRALLEGAAAIFKAGVGNTRTGMQVARGVRRGRKRMMGEGSGSKGQYEPDESSRRPHGDGRNTMGATRKGLAGAGGRDAVQQGASPRLRLVRTNPTDDAFRW